MDAYEIGTAIGSGGFGRVFRAIRNEDGTECAIKVLLDSADVSAVNRFRREVRMQAQLRHKHIVPIIDYHLDSTEPWFSMPRAEINLRTYLDELHGESE